jgi:NADH dehydrogenase FAD-containing subunit
MSKQLVLIGGGHAHMVTLANLHVFVEKGYGVIVIQPSEYHYYSGMGPGMLGGTYRPDDIRFATRRQVEAKGGRFVLGKAYKIDPDKQCVYVQKIVQGAEGKIEEEIPYDVLSCNAGSYVPQEMVRGDADNIFTAKPIEALLTARQRILELAEVKKITIALVGSGPSAIELSGNIHQLCREQGVEMPRIQLFAGRTFMAGRPAQVRRLTRTILERKGVEIIEAGYVKEIENGRLLLENDHSYLADIIFPAVGVRPSPIFGASGLPVGPDGGLLVDAYLRSTGYKNIFGGGDCISFAPQPLDKVGVYAVRQNGVLYNNLMACLDEKEPEKFSPGGTYLLIYNLGDGEGVLAKWFITFSGGLAFRIKDYIDRKFIRSFQNT